MSLTNCLHAVSQFHENVCCAHTLDIIVVLAEVYIATAAMLCLKICFLDKNELVPSGTCRVL